MPRSRSAARKRPPRRTRRTVDATPPYAHGPIIRHFAPTPPEALVTASREYPSRLRLDLQKALDALFPDGSSHARSLGFSIKYPMPTFGFPALLDRGQYAPVIAPAQYAEVDIGEAVPSRCLENGLWLFAEDGIPAALLLSVKTDYAGTTTVRLEVAVVPGERGAAVARRCLDAIQARTLAASTYRGKVLSLEPDEYRGKQSTGISVHTLPAVSRDDIILPRATLDLLERNVLWFVEQRAKLGALQMSKKKGLLFYGPPGTGKTHTIKYLASCLRGTTTLLITAEQMGLLGEYMTLARLLQPSMVVIEDADLIARARESMGSPCEESLLNRLLNEMDGLREDVEVLFVLTTNHPQALEAALSARPGRIDQAVEFPLPDEENRAKLIRLYAQRAPLHAGLVEEVARRTHGVSAAFIKELMRRSAQYMIESGREEVRREHVDQAIEEMLFSGGRLNRMMLGADDSSSSPAPSDPGVQRPSLAR